MLEAAEVGNRIDKHDFEKLEGDLRVRLLQAQDSLRTAGFEVVVVIAGDDHRGCHQTIQILNEWMDPRGIATNVFDDPTQEERERPEFWRYWRMLPGKGRIAVFAGAWAFRAFANRVCKRIDQNQFENALERAQRFETMLADDGVLLLKFWLHLPAKKAEKRLGKARKDPARYGPFGRTDRAILKNHPRAMSIAEQVIRDTTTPDAPWHLIESTDKRHRHLTVARILAEVLERGLAQDDAPQGPATTPAVVHGEKTVLDTVDLDNEIDKSDYNRLLPRRQARLRALNMRAHRAGISTVLVFEGWDAAGKGGVIRRLGAAMDAATYRVVPIAAPTDEERAHHYLWRFWRHLPRDGYTTIFDRSWYGRVLVERVEGFARESEWQRAYAEIDEFEQELIDHGMVVQKFWLHIDPDEQLRRFHQREQTPFKTYKITEDDYRNRERWDDYVQAVRDMVARTSTDHAPWHLIAANDKRYARLEVLRLVATALHRRLKDT